MNNNTVLFNVFNFANFIICASMSLIAPFFPTYALEEGLSKPLVGMIIALHPFGGIIGSIQIGKILTDRNRKNMLIGSMGVQAICLLLFIFTYFIRNYWFITIISLLSRFVNGIAYSVFVTSFYSYIPILYPKEQEQKVALAEAASALGYMLGPMIGSILYAIGGFTFPFFTFIVFSILCSFQINKQNLSLEKETIEVEMIEINQMELSSTDDSEERLTYFKVLSNYEVMINSLMCVMVTMSITINFPLMAQYFQDYYQIKEETVGFYMGLQPMTYTLATLAIIKIPNPHKPTYMLLFQILLGISLFYFGPDVSFTGLNRNLTICCLSLIISGIAQAFPLIYSLPQINESMIELFPEQKRQCLNFASAIFSASISVGEFSGPFFGGLLSSFLELDRIASITGILSLILCFAYLPFYRKHKRL